MNNDQTLIDRFGRQITYLRLSVTDRCDLRCQYCMSEKMHFLSKADVLSYEEMLFLCDIFIARGVKKIRVSGGEPLVRKDIGSLFQGLGRRIGQGGVQGSENGLEELVLTTNATQLDRHADALVDCGVRRINVSLDTLDRAVFHRLTRRDKLTQTLAGIEAAQKAGLQVKINTVVLKNYNKDELSRLIDWAHERYMDITLIETMPLGFVDEDRYDQYVPLLPLQDQLVHQLALQPSSYRSGGPAVYFNRPGSVRRVGFISPLTNNFCSGCNRVRITCSGEIYTCLGQDSKMDLRPALKAQDAAALNALLDLALMAKPEGHEFAITKDNPTPATARHMSVTGG